MIPKPKLSQQEQDALYDAYQRGIETIPEPAKTSIQAYIASIMQENVWLWSVVTAPAPAPPDDQERE